MAFPVKSIDRTRVRRIATAPDPRQYAGHLLAWAICWPWTLLWTLLTRNPLRHGVTFAMREVRGVLDEISRGQLEATVRDLQFDDEDEERGPSDSDADARDHAIPFDAVPAAAASPSAVWMLSAVRASDGLRPSDPVSAANADSILKSAPIRRDRSQTNPSAHRVEGDGSGPLSGWRPPTLAIRSAGDAARGDDLDALIARYAHDGPSQKVTRSDDGQ